MSPNLIGQTLGRYRLLEEIGRGRGVVYKAHDTALNRIVAVKVLAPHLTRRQESLQRFHREAQAAARLKHPHIITVYEVGQAQGYYFIAMEYLEGRSLDEIIRRQGPLPLERAIHILGQIAQALDHAHAQGVIHRDVKPGNVVISSNDRATLTDFGVAYSLGGARLTRPGTIVGTPTYMSPEQVKGQTVGAATDVYALGIVAYEMLGGRPPFEGDTLRLLHAHVYEEPPPLHRMNPQISPAIEAVVHKALAKEVRKRHRTGRTFVKALERAVGSRGTKTPPVPSANWAPLWPLLGVLAALLLLVVVKYSAEG